MAGTSGTLYITYVESYGAFLKIWGQMDRQLPLIIEKSLIQMTPQFDQGHFIPSPDSVQSGTLCCAKYKDGSYYRARILNVLPQGLVEVQFLDYGNKDVVPLINLRLIQTFAPGLVTTPPQVKDFILANVTHEGSSFSTATIALISNEIRYMELTWVTVAQVGSITLIKLYNKGDDVALSLFNRGFVLSIATVAQQTLLQNSAHYQPQIAAIVNPLTSPQIAVPSPTIVNYKAFTLESGSENEVYISYVSDGPCHFSVQLKKFENNLAKLMNELNYMNLQPLEDNPLPGAVCVARCLEDDHICRAVVTSVVDNRYKVFYVDFGNTEVVPIDNLYQIPFKYVIPKVMAMRYALAGLERSSVTLEMKCAFKEFVSEKLLLMRALPSPARSALPLCVLWDQNQINVLDILQRAALLAYPEVIQLTRGFCQEIRVSYVHSCSHFYVQIISKEEELVKIMAELQVNCPDTEQIQLSQVKVGLPCCALFEGDGQWYRAQVISQDGETVKVHYVDYGNEDTVHANNLKKIPSGELLTALRPQALECCLNGYQNMEDDLERDNILEELILEKEFTMKVVEMQGNRALVDLIDGARYNVGSLLLERIASARSQVSPLLIQDGHQIEHRKRRSPGGSPRNASQQNHAIERKPLRDQNNKGRNNIQESWRQSKPPPRKETNDQHSEDTFNTSQGRRDGFKKDNWGGKSNDKGGNWKRTQRSPNQREGSEKSWSDSSDKNWRRNSRASNFSNSEDKKPKRRQDLATRGNSLNSLGNSITRSSHSAKVSNPAPTTATFSSPLLVGQTENVVISWFHDPAHFFCQLQESQNSFRQMMEEIQNTYCNIKPEQAYNSSSVVALFPEDGVMYRARILETKGTDYRVQYVDFGNVSITDKVWPIDIKFMTLPAQAICCGLSGLLPMQETWGNADVFSSYFEKESFTCNFLSSDNHSYLVELTSDGKNINEALVADGLAKYEEPATVGLNNFDCNILLGQQIVVMLGEVQSLDLFNLKLQNGIQLVCAMHNLSSATETFEDTLKQMIGNSVIMYTDNILEDKLEVTLYDLSGVKLKIIEPDEGAYETLEMPCPFPIFYSQIRGWVTYLTPANENKFNIYIQPSEYADAVAHLLENLFNHYDKSAVENAVVTPNIGSVYAVLSSDSNWYRGQVTAVDEQNVTVLFVDYGNSETVSTSEIRTLAPEFLEQHILAVQATATDIDGTFIEQEVLADVWYGENGWEAQIQLVNQSNNEAQTEINMTPKASTLDQNEEHPNEVGPVYEEQQQEQQQPPPDTEPTRGVPVVLSHIDSPNEFYLQLAEELEAIENIQATLQEQVATYPVLENPAAGVLCVAPYSIDQNWYRAQVLDADSDITTVRFVDYGNTDVLTNISTQVKTLPSDLLALEQHARRCSLIVKSSDVEWSPVASDRFEQLTKCDKLFAQIIHQDEKTTYVELYANRQNVAEILQQEGLAVKMEFETESSCTGYVSNLNSPSEFWIQLENSVADLEWIAEQLSTAETFPELEDLTPGSLCAALFPDDEMWYRARILSNTVAGLEVLFVDYGNSCTCTGLRQLPEDLIMLPPLAQKYSLQKPPGILQWSTEATVKFQNLSADGATIFNIHKLSTGETSVVKLLLDDVDITTNLLPTTKDASVSHFESISNFWLQKIEDIPKLTEISERLLSAEEWPKYDPKNGSELIAALWLDNGKWYRARILSEKDSSYEVQFIDYGISTTTKEIRVLSDEIEQLPPLAVKCRLEPLTGYRWSKDSSTKLKELITEGNAVFQVEFAEGDVVRLYLNGYDIRSDLDSIPISAQNSPKKSFTWKTESDIRNVTSVVETFSTSLGLHEIVAAPVMVKTFTDVEMLGDLDSVRYSSDSQSVLMEEEECGEIKDSVSNVGKSFEPSVIDGEMAQVIGLALDTVREHSQFKGVKSLPIATDQQRSNCFDKISQELYSVVDLDVKESNSLLSEETTESDNKTNGTVNESDSANKSLEDFAYDKSYENNKQSVGANMEEDLAVCTSDSYDLSSHGIRGNIRRQSHEEKIVPVTVSRGEIHELDTESPEKVISNISESVTKEETSEVDKTSIISSNVITFKSAVTIKEVNSNQENDDVDNYEKIEDEESSVGARVEEDLSVSTSDNHDLSSQDAGGNIRRQSLEEKIVPGAVSRGEINQLDRERPEIVLSKISASVSKEETSEVDKPSIISSNAPDVTTLKNATTIKEVGSNQESDNVKNYIKVEDDERIVTSTEFSEGSSLNNDDSQENLTDIDNKG